MKAPAPPVGLKAAGERLWKAVVADFDLDEHELRLLSEAARTCDVIDDLQAIVDADGVLIKSRLGETRAHPAVVELRQQRALLARLIVSLRVPLGDEGEDAPSRPQLRAIRGPYRGAS